MKANARIFATAIAALAAKAVRRKTLGEPLPAPTTQRALIQSRLAAGFDPAFGANRLCGLRDDADCPIDFQDG